MTAFFVGLTAGLLAIVTMMSAALIWLGRRAVLGLEREAEYAQLQGEARLWAEKQDRAVQELRDALEKCEGQLGRERLARANVETQIAHLIKSIGESSDPSVMVHALRHDLERLRDLATPPLPDVPKAGSADNG